MKRFCLIAVLLAGLLAVVSIPDINARAQKGKKVSPQYQAELQGDAGSPEWKIRSDGQGRYSPVSVNSSGGLFMYVDKADGRWVQFQFNDPDPDYQNPLCCEKASTREPYFREYPAYMLSDDKIVEPDRTRIMSGYELTYEDGKWVRIVDYVRKGTTYYKMLNLLGLSPGEKAYGKLLIEFWLGDSDDVYDVNFNDTFHRDLNPGEHGGGFNGGIVEVEAGPDNCGSAGDFWYIRPISSNFPVLGTPPIPTLPNQANHRISDFSDLKTDPWGGCDLGNFFMKFELTIRRIQ